MCSGDTQPLNLGQYRLLDELGRGGMGRVYKALHTIMGRIVAIKVIAPELMQDPVAVEWFRREVRAGTQLVHPNIVMAYDANEAEGLHFLVMEFVHGITLDAFVKQNGPLPIARACALIRQAALGLQHAHEKGMVHRDIKPGNLLIPLPEGDNSPDVLVKILDFGLARLQGKTAGDTIALRGDTGVLGTPDYIAPEQSRDIHSADIRSDLYSLGCTFYFSLSGRVPFPGDNAMEKLVKHLTEQPEPLEKVRPAVPSQVADIVRRLMAKNPADRPQTPAELVEELDTWTLASSADFPATLPPNRPSWLSPPTHTPADELSVADQSPSHTCILEKIEVFAPSRREVESSGSSLFEPLCPLSPDEARQPDTHDTLSLSHIEETERSSPSAECGDSDATLQELPTASTPCADKDNTLPPLDPVMSRLWRRWSDLVHTIVAGSGPSRVNADAYRSVHTSLLQACRAALDACTVPERRAFYEECLSIVRPWLNLQSFVHTEPMLLESLLHRCKQIEFELHDGKTPWTSRQIFGLILLTLSPLGAALWYWNSGRLLLPSLLRAFNWDFSLSSLRLAWRFLQAHPSLLMGVIFPLVIIFSVVLLSRSSRT
jgi:serine/threonine protein kinase